MGNILINSLYLKSIYYICRVIIKLKFNKMKKSDLKNGMIVETRKGETALVVKDNCYGEDAIIFSTGNWTSLDCFNERLIWHPESRDSYTKTVDIVKVFKPNLPTGFLDKSCDVLLWERKESIPEFTMEELVKKMGYEFKIKK